MITGKSKIALIPLFWGEYYFFDAEFLNVCSWNITDNYINVIITKVSRYR